jgi:DNA-3-methyladenine glycosylase
MNGAITMLFGHDCDFHVKRWRADLGWLPDLPGGGPASWRARLEGGWRRVSWALARAGRGTLAGVLDAGTVPGALLPREFFVRPALDVAARLLGCVLEHQAADGLVAVTLTEVEAYEGSTDPASHAYRGRTARTEVMFGPPGHAYVYFTYGMHFCVNLVCLGEGTASAVLLRAGRVSEGAALAAARRPAATTARDLARGPARLCQALAIGRAQNGVDVCDPASPLRVRAPQGEPLGATPTAGAAPTSTATATATAGPTATSTSTSTSTAGATPISGATPTAGTRPAPGAPSAAGLGISQGPRVGVSAAGDRPWRFWLTADPTVSAYRPHTPRRGRPPADR